MKVRIKKAEELKFIHGDSQWSKKMCECAGLILDVNTDHLHFGQYTCFYPGCKKGDPSPAHNTTQILVMERQVAEIIEDARLDAGQCENCGLCYEKIVSRGLVGSLCERCAHTIVKWPYMSGRR